MPTMAPPPPASAEKNREDHPLSSPTSLSRVTAKVSKAGTKIRRRMSRPPNDDIELPPEKTKSGNLG